MRAKRITGSYSRGEVNVSDNATTPGGLSGHLILLTVLAVRRRPSRATQVRAAKSRMIQIEAKITIQSLVSLWSAIVLFGNRSNPY